MKKIILVLWVMCSFSSVSLKASSSSEFVDAKTLRHNVVAIQAEWDNKTHNGFGWVVGVNDNKVYIITANHIVRGKKKGAIDRSPTVTLYMEKQRITVGVKLLPQNDNALDLAILEMPLPDKLLIKYAVADFNKATESTPVTYIGAATRWEVPNKAEGIITDSNNTHLLVKGLNVDVGTSGAPLIGKNGILGMFISNAATSSAEVLVNTANVLTIGTIKNKVEGWQYPWSLGASIATSLISGNWHYLFPEDEPIHVSAYAYPETPHHYAFNAKLASGEKVASGVGVVDGNEFRVVYESVLVPSTVKAELLVKVGIGLSDQTEAVLMEGIVSFTDEFGEPTTEIMRLVKLKSNGDYFAQAKAYMKENPHPELEQVHEGEAIAKQISEEYSKKYSRPPSSNKPKVQSLNTAGTPNLPANPQIAVLMIQQMQNMLKMARITEVSLSLTDNCIVAEGQVDDPELIEKIGSILQAMSAHGGMKGCNKVKLAAP